MATNANIHAYWRQWLQSQSLHLAMDKWLWIQCAIHVQVVRRCIQALRRLTRLGPSNERNKNICRLHCCGPDSAGKCDGVEVLMGDSGWWSDFCREHLAREVKRSFEVPRVAIAEVALRSIPAKVAIGDRAMSTRWNRMCSCANRKHNEQQHSTSHRCGEWVRERLSELVGEQAIEQTSMSASTSTSEHVNVWASTHLNRQKSESDCWVCGEAFFHGRFCWSSRSWCASCCCNVDAMYVFWLGWWSMSLASGRYESLTQRDVHLCMSFPVARGSMFLFGQSTAV